MQRTLLRSKIHGARVTQADLNYIGSITIDRTLLEAVDLWPNEKVLVVNLENGSRLETYVFEGEALGVIGMNGAAPASPVGDRPDHGLRLHDGARAPASRRFRGRGQRHRAGAVSAPSGSAERAAPVTRAGQVNLTRRAGRRPDAYHEIESVRGPRLGRDGVLPRRTPGVTRGRGRRRRADGAGEPGGCDRLA
jgi:hypothetical protein